ncbi:hypothetical protein MPSEU_000380800 [Mayamaea pseudoterrestris]|nr:hypothetical protein MPSEU_000380800 [Mayamaea pseudoterrestris]
MRVSLLLLISCLCKHASATVLHFPRVADTRQPTAPANSRHFAASLSLPRGGSEQAKIFKRFASDTRMPSLFSSDDSVFDKYAACLAATEGLRRIRDRDMMEEVKSNDIMASSQSDREQLITKEYVKNTAKVLQVMGLTVKQFNELGKQISRDERLREKVMEQAYLYRMAATIQMDKFPLVEDNLRSSEGLQDFQRDKVELFCESMSEIEHLREDQIERLKRALQVDTFPASLSISDPSLMPFLSPKVRAVVEAFPYQAEEIIKKHGLDSEEFNQMLAETKTNPKFRWKVQKHIRNQGEQQGQRR